MGCSDSKVQCMIDDGELKQWQLTNGVQYYIFEEDVDECLVDMSENDAECIDTEEETAMMFADPDDRTCIVFKANGGNRLYAPAHNNRYMDLCNQEGRGKRVRSGEKRAKLDSDYGATLTIWKHKNNGDMYICTDNRKWCLEWGATKSTGLEVNGWYSKFDEDDGDAMRIVKTSELAAVRAQKAAAKQSWNFASSLPSMSSSGVDYEMIAGLLALVLILVLVVRFLVPRGLWRRAAKKSTAQKPTYGAAATEATAPLLL